MSRWSYVPEGLVRVARQFIWRVADGVFISPNHLTRLK